MRHREVTRYVAAPRLSWVPPLFVVVDSATGSVISKHRAEADAKSTAKDMNAKLR